MTKDQNPRHVWTQVQLKGSGAPVVLDVASAGGEPAITIAKVSCLHSRKKHSSYIG